MRVMPALIRMPCVRSKAVLKQPHSKRFATAKPSTYCAERLDCVRFTATFVRGRDMLGISKIRPHRELPSVIFNF